MALFFRILTFFIFFVLSFSNSVFATQEELFKKYYTEKDLEWHIESHKKRENFTLIDKQTNWNPESRNIAFIRITINDNEELKPNILFYSGGKTRETPGGKGILRVNVFSYIEQNINEWAKHIQEFLKKHTGIEPTLEHIQKGFVTHSEIAIFMYLIKEDLLSKSNNIIIDIASKHDACKLQCSNFLNGFVKENKNIVIRFSGGMADQPGTERDTRNTSTKKNEIRYQVYSSGTQVDYNSGVFKN